MRPLSRWLSQPPDGESPVALDRDHRHTAGALARHVAGLCEPLRERPEQRWLLVSDNSYRFAAGLLAGLHAGKTLILPPNAQSGSLTGLGAEALLGEADTPLPTLGLDPLPEAPVDTANWSPLDPDRQALTVVTSGSTGTPRVLTKPLRCFEAELATLESLWGETLGTSVVFATVSHQHIYGLLFRVLWPLCAGRPFTAETYPYPETLVAALQQHDRSTLVASPAQLRRFSPQLDLGPLRERLTMVFSSGGPLPRATALEWRDRAGHTPIEVLGSTETGGVAWRQRQDTEQDTPWQPFPPVSVRQERSGVLAVRSSFLASDDWFVMGDRVTVHTDGRFLLHGRADTIVKIEEKRVSLTQMEQHLAAHPAVTEARVIPLPDNPNRLGAVVVLTPTGRDTLTRDGKPALNQALKAHLLTHFERVTLPRKWRYPEALPVNTQSKTPLPLLHALFQAAPSTPPLPGRPTRDTGDQRVYELPLGPHPALFEGHFPEVSLLPGVMQLDWAIRAAADWFPNHTFRRADKLKFQAFIRPDDTVTLTVTRESDRQARFTYHRGPALLSSGRLRFEGTA